MNDLAKPLIYDQIIGDELSPSLRMLSHLIPTGARVLDVGCASGFFAEHLQARGCPVVGVDYSQDAVDVARQRGLNAYQIDLESETLDSANFDIVVFADVLEHLRNPEQVLESVKAPRVLISLPNIAFWGARRTILRGRFPWEDYGLFDITHLRFYTRDNARSLIEKAGFGIAAEQFNFGILPFEGRFRSSAVLTRRLAARYPGLFAFQLIYDARR